MNTHCYFVYILASKRNGTLYVGVTSNLNFRVCEHKNNIIEGFTKKYNIHLLVYFEMYSNIHEAIQREKYIKGKSRKFKLNLIESKNPEWKDMYVK